MKKKKTIGGELFSAGKKLIVLAKKQRKKHARLRARREGAGEVLRLLIPSQKRKRKITAGGAIALAAAAVAAPIFLLSPGRAKEEEKKKFTGRYYAHRGLYEEDQSIPENSLPAFRRAVEWGYGIELDVQLTRDGYAVVFHDDDLIRATGDLRRVDEVDWAELKTLPLFGTKKRIPLFREVLAVVEGRVPLIVELKSGRRNYELCRSVRAILGSYDGDACIESFDPRIVAWFRHNDPKRIRGQLAQPPRYYERVRGMNAVSASVLGNTLCNAVARPHFIAYRIGDKPAAVRVAEALGALRVGWTSRNPENPKDFDAVIFEHYRPGKKL